MLNDGIDAPMDVALAAEPYQPRTAGKTAAPRPRRVLHRSGYSYEQLDTPDFLETPGCSHKGRW